MHPGRPSVCFPNEIYSEILQHLHYLRDRHVLLSTALVSQALRRESQRVLFSYVDVDGGHTWRRTGDAIKIHSLFLQAVIDHPQRLGPYVLAYTQDALACHPQTANCDWEHLSSSMHLWELTRNALPHMVNLRYLFFRAAFRAPYPSENLLSDCTFHLQTLIWECSQRTPEYLEPFLLTQRHLHHLKWKQSPELKNSRWLSRDACPNLISTSCNTDAMSILVHRQKIVAMDIWMSMSAAYIPTDDNCTVLRRLTYLRVDTWLLEAGFPGTVLPNIVLLSITSWHFEVLECLTSFPKLQVLVLRDVTSKAANTLKRAVLHSFQQCPLLKRVISHNKDNLSSHTSFTIMRSEDDTQEEVKEQVTYYEHDLSHMWWSRFNV